MASGNFIDTLIQTLRGMDGHTASAALLFVLLLCGLGLPVPEDIILITAGLLASMGKFPLWWAILAGMIGVLSGDSMLFFLGRRYGEGVFAWRPIARMLSPEKLADAKVRVQRNAHFICFIARFLPGLRSPIYLTAGALGIPPRVYITQDLFAATISVPLWVVLGWYFGAEIEQALLLARDFQRSMLVMVVLAVVGWFFWSRRRARLEAEKDAKKAEGTE